MLVGPAGGARSRATAIRRPASTADVRATVHSAPGSGLTVVVGLPKGTIQPPPEPILEKRKTLANAFAVTPAHHRARRRPGRCSASVCVVLARATRAPRPPLHRLGGRRRDGQHLGRGGAGAAAPPATGPVEFIPPDGIRPGQVGTLVDEHANLLDVTATIVDLAVRGWLTITELEPEAHERHPDYELTATPGKGKGTPLPYEQVLLNELFDNRNTVKLSDLKYKFRDEPERDPVRDVRRRGRAGLVPHATRPDHAIWVGISVLVLATESA